MYILDITLKGMFLLSILKFYLFRNGILLTINLKVIKVK